MVVRELLEVGTLEENEAIDVDLKRPWPRPVLELKVGAEVMRLDVRLRRLPLGSTSSRRSEAGRRGGSRWT